MAGDQKPKRDPPAPPTQSAKNPPHIPPPSYEEVAGPKKNKNYPQEKQTTSRSSSNHNSRPHRSHSDSTGHPRREKSEGETERRDRTHRGEKSSRKHRSSSKKSPLKGEARNLDVIDKLDVSSFFGGRFHHDGPFDACTPHRNRNVKAAPVMAFPADGPNNTMKARTNADKNDPMNLAFGNYEDHNMIVGTAVPGGSPYSKPTVADPQIAQLPRLNPSVVAFDVNQKAVPVHGPSTFGLGSTTFVDGAPVSKAEEVINQNSQASAGIGRKKSIVQRLRKNSGADASATRKSSEVPENGRSSFGDDEAGSSLLRRVKSLKVGRK